MGINEEEKAILNLGSIQQVFQFEKLGTSALLRERKFIVRRKYKFAKE